eukprot:gene39933-52718_t
MYICSYQTVPEGTATPGRYGGAAGRRRKPSSVEALMKGEESPTRNQQKRQRSTSAPPRASLCTIRSLADIVETTLEGPKRRMDDSASAGKSSLFAGAKTPPPQQRYSLLRRYNQDRPVSIAPYALDCVS